MDYEKKYKEALAHAREIHRNEEEKRRDMEFIFPELKESEDERVRKGLIKAVARTFEGSKLFGTDVTREEALSWLEKQGDHVENNEDDLDTDFTIYHPLKNGKGHYECIPYSFYGTLTSFSEDKDLIDFLRLCFYTKEECNEWIKQNESADKAEPKFKVGDFIVNDYCRGRVVELTDDAYLLDTGQGIPFSCEHNAHLWTLDDAKDGDVLWHSDSASNGIFIFKEIRYDGKVLCYCDYDSEDHFCLGEHHTCCWSNAKYIHPATKEQRDTLFAKMKEEGYEWSEETHELKKISQRMVSAEAKEALYDKPTDEEMKELLRTEYEKGRADTIAEMEKDWSEEDEIARKALINLVEIYYGGCIDKTEKKRLLNLLKSLRPQKQWKPSDEQMNTLNLVVSDYYHACTKECDEKAIVLKSILEQLKQKIEG